MRRTVPGCGISWRATVRAAWIRTALSFAGHGFAVDKFGRTPGLVHLAGYLGIIMTLVGLLFTIIGFAQHRTVLTEEKPPPAHRAHSMARGVADAACALACASWPHTLPSS